MAADQNVSPDQIGTIIEWLTTGQVIHEYPIPFEKPSS